MSNPLCDKAVLEAAMTNPELQKLLRSYNKTQDAILAEMDRMAKLAAAETMTPAPSRSTNFKALDALIRGAGVAAEEIPSYIDHLANARVSFMLQRVSTHIKNIISTGGMVTVQRPLEQAISIALSKALPGESRQFKELMATWRGTTQGAVDAVSALRSMLPEYAKVDTVSQDAFKKVLGEAGYPIQLSYSKTDMIMGNAIKGSDSRFSRSMLGIGSRYLARAFLQGPFDMLQAEDIIAKMAVYRARVSEELFREGLKNGVKPGEALDDYLVKNWNRHMEANKAEYQKWLKEGNMEDLAEGTVAQKAAYDASEYTFTQQPETSFGWMMAHAKVPTPFGTFHIPGAKIISPFRNIYVNLYRQTLSKRLLAPFNASLNGKVYGLSPSVWKEFTSPDPIVRQTALARVAGGYTMLMATAGIATMGAVKFFGRDEVNPSVREMQREMYGVVGDTIRIGEGADAMYVPLDAMPPTIAIPAKLFLGYLSAEEAMEYRETVNPGEEQETRLHAMLGSGMKFLSSNGPWVVDYSRFLSTMGDALQSGNPDALGNAVARILVGTDPTMGLRSLAGIERPLEEADGFRSTVDNFIRYVSAEKNGNPLKRDFFGDPMLPPDRAGIQSQPPHTPDQEEFIDLARAYNFDRMMPRNAAMKLKIGDYDHKFNSFERDAFNQYQAKTEISGLLRHQAVLAAWKSPDAANWEDLNRKEVTASVLDEYREFARTLMKYDPRFGIAEKAIAKNLEMGKARGATDAELNQARMAMEQEAVMMRQQLAPYFIR